MRRFSSMKYATAETRRILRDRFARYLPVTKHTQGVPSGANLILDEQWLNLLLKLEIVSESDVRRARAVYEAALPKTGTEPTFDEVIAEGWMRVVWGRISAPFEFDERARMKPDGNLTALSALFKVRFNDRFSFDDSVRGDSEIARLAAEIERGDKTPYTVRSQNPDWVAARLWDRSLSDTASDSNNLRRWVDRWSLMGLPHLVPHQVWSETAANAFREAALDVVQSEQGLASWAEIRGGFVKQTCLRTGQPPEIAGQQIPVLPASLLDRALWLNDRRLEGPIAAAMAAEQNIAWIVRLLLNDVEEQEFAKGPHADFTRLMDLAVTRPEILAVVLFKVRWSPALLADLALYPATSALACWIIAEWPGPHGAWDRELRAQDDKATKAIAFGDAVSVLGHFLEQGSIPAAEVASLLRFLYRTTKPLFGDDAAGDPSIVTILRDEIARQSVEMQQAISAALGTGIEQSGLGTAEFAAALDLVDAAGLMDSIQPEPLVSAYVRSITAGVRGRDLSAGRISESAAGSLVRLAMKAPEELCRTFFAPIDVRTRIAAAAAEPDANLFLIEDEIARALRAHIRILCRAVATLGESKPEALTEALTKSVHIGAVKHDEKGRVGAFAARFEVNRYGRRDRPMASDLGTAVTTLVGAERDALVAVILDIDEPIVLAQLTGYVPQEVRTRIEARLNTLVPSDAARIGTLPEAMARIQALLTASQAATAARYIDDERKLTTWGKVGGRELAQFRDDLHIKWLRRDWHAIWEAQPPPELAGQTRDAAIDQINFFKGLAALSDPNGNSEGAENFLGQLHSRHPHVPTYGVNLIAARISTLLKADKFAQLQGPALTRGRQILAEAEQAMLQMRDASAADLETFCCNKALLLLALGEPNRAIDALESVTPDLFRDTLAAYRAVALNRLGRSREALAVLDQAAKAIGETAQLLGVREYIRSGTQFATSISLIAADDRVQRTKIAYFNLLSMDPQEQAAIVVEDAEPFVSFIVRQVRSAAESVISALAAMKVTLPRYYEDDLTGLMRMPLSASVRFLQWDIAEQAPGGYSPLGNPGKRDLTVQNNGWILAVIEAVLCRDPVTYQSVQENLASHFRRLLGYFPGALFFHVAYSYVDDPSTVLGYLKQAAVNEVPAGYAYRGIIREIEVTDSRPGGFIAEYDGPQVPLKVVFLVLDMRQFAQREAAKSTRKSMVKRMVKKALPTKKRSKKR